MNFPIVVGYTSGPKRDGEKVNRRDGKKSRRSPMLQEPQSALAIVTANRSMAWEEAESMHMVMICT
jgi:hypothetical protein